MDYALLPGATIEVSALAKYMSSLVPRQPYRTIHWPTIQASGPTIQHGPFIDVPSH